MICPTTLCLFHVIYERSASGARCRRLLPPLLVLLGFGHGPTSRTDPSLRLLYTLWQLQRVQLKQPDLISRIPAVECADSLNHPFLEFCRDEPMHTLRKLNVHLVVDRKEVGAASRSRSAQVFKSREIDRAGLIWRFDVDQIGDRSVAGIIDSGRCRAALADEVIELAADLDKRVDGLEQEGGS